MSDDPSFFHLQHRLLGVLRAWGIGSAVAGALAMLSRSQVLRHIGIQAVAWGAIDAALAWFGRRGARAKIASGATDGATQARRLRTILLVNAGLDVGYIAGGLVLARSARGRSDRLGAGLGIAVQGVFLLCYDAVFAQRIAGWLNENVEH